MTVLIVLAVLVAIALVVGSALLINQYSQERYRYAPFSLPNIVTIVIAIAMLFLANHLVPDGQEFSNIVSEAINLRVTLEASNTVALVGLAALVTIGLYINISVRSNFLIGTYAFVVQLLAAVVVLALLWLIFIIGSSKNEAEQEKAKAKAAKTGEVATVG